jgi:hypothetical protein
MAIEESLDMRNGRPSKKSNIVEIDALSLEEFKVGLTNRGFKPSSRNPSIYLSPHTPDFRFVIRNKVVRLESKNTEANGREWQLDTSYLISRHLRTAIKAVDQLGLEPEIIYERKVMSSGGEIISFLVFGSVLLIGGFLVVLIPDSINRIIGILFLASGTGILIHVRKSIISRKAQSKFRFQTVAADVIGRQVKADDGADQSAPRSDCYLTIGFTPTALESADKRVWIRAHVSEQIYGSYIRGSTIEVRYASEDPRFVILEGE